ncbi:hemolysin III family protein [Ascidiaceihabitans sp.]|uniref:PAQR family membrane homeostasis protein TrhA n=1 Tax=Ascidiaceihabitans sp. TaxID=1872644 RepID=UPI00329A4A3E
MAQSSADHYPTYSPFERRADALVHGVAIAASALGAVYLVLASTLPGFHLPATLLYGAIIVFSFAASAAYHFAPNETVRPARRRLDHAAIFLKIAATYTPLVALINTPFSYVVLVVVWGIGLYGAARKMFFWQSPGPGSLLLYLGMGWLSVSLAKPVITHLPTPTIWLVTIGGLTYSVGTIFYRWEGLRFSNAIWHGFVLVASACFFAGIAYAQAVMLP